MDQMTILKPLLNPLSILHVQSLVMDECEDIEDGEVRRNLYKGRSENPPNCEICNKVFPWARNTSEDFETYIKPHILTDHSWICSECNDLFYTEEDLKKHMLEHLRTNRSVKCAYCGKLFDTLSKYTKHVTTYHNCTFCNFVSSTGAGILKHKRLVHFNWHECSKCPNIYISSTEINRHFSIAHKCAYCGKIKTNEVFLTKHKRLNHLGWFSCLHCRNIFETEEQMTNHTKTAHLSFWLVGNKCGHSK